MHKKDGVTTMKIKTIKSDRCDIYAPDRNRNIYDDYAEDILLPEDKRDFEKHLESCPICSRQVVDALRREEIVNKSPLMSNSSQKRSLNRKLQYLDEIFGRDAGDIAFAEDAAMLPLAASPPRRLDVHGVAYGVAVNKKTGQGALLECIALVDNLSKVDSQLEIIAKESITTTRDGVEIKVTTPTTYLEELLKAMFKRHPLLKPFKLYEKAICVEVNYKAGTGYIYESDSVALAVLVAILSAVTSMPVDKDILFSAGIKLNGYLEGVGDLNHKIQIAKNQRMKTCFTADETRPISADKTIKKSGIALHYFDKLDEVLTTLGLIEKKSGSGKKKNRNAHKEKITKHVSRHRNPSVTGWGDNNLL